MKRECDRERQVIEAAVENRLAGELRSHVESCAECRAAAAAAGWMERFARIEDREHILPDPAMVWLKAQLLGGKAAVQRATRPITAVQMIAYGVVAAAWAGLLTWKWSALQNWLLTLTPAHFLAGVSGGGAGAASLSLTFFALVLVLSSVTVLLALHTILAEE